MTKTISLTNFTRQLGQRLAGMAVSPETISLAQAGALVTTRLAGGYITQLKLPAPDGMPIVVFHDDPEPPDAIKPKKNASHIMSPVGANNGLGGQHGIYRWCDYSITAQTSDSFTICSQVPDEYPRLQKMIQVSKQGLTMCTTIANQTAQTIHTSLGEHLYWYLEGGKSAGLKVVFQDPVSDGPFKNPDILKAVMAGESYFWLPSSLNCRIYRPDGSVLSLVSEARMKEGAATRAVPAGMLLWRRPGTESICFEPAIGIETDTMNTPLLTSSLPNRGLRLTPGAEATLETRISVVTSP